MTGLRTFDTTGTTLRRVGKTFTIACDSDEIANRVADQLRAEPQTTQVSLPAWAVKDALNYMDACRENRPSLIPIGVINLIRNALALSRPDERNGGPQK